MSNKEEEIKEEIKEEIDEKKEKKIECECGSKVLRNNFKRHLKSKLHQFYIDIKSIL